MELVGWLVKMKHGYARIAAHRHASVALNG